MDPVYPTTRYDESADAHANLRPTQTWLADHAPQVTGIDTHAHVFVRGLPLAPTRRHAPDYDATLSAYCAHLQHHAISHAVLVQPSFLGTDNTFFVDVLKRFPARFRGVAVVDPAITANALRGLAAAGVVGLRLNLLGLPLPDLSETRWQNLLIAANQLNLHIEVHRAAADLPHILPALLDQGCTVVVDHFGRPDPALGTQDPGFQYLLSLASTRQVWVKLSAAYRSAYGDSGTQLGAQLAKPLLKAFTPARLVWGSDWPHTQHREFIDYPKARAALDQWVPDPLQRQTILTDSAATLFRFDSRLDRLLSRDDPAALLPPEKNRRTIGG
jgi:predicted TIM-barrel fold metal-dependent hydrolase